MVTSDPQVMPYIYIYIYIVEVNAACNSDFGTDKNFPLSSASLLPMTNETFALLFSANLK